MAYVVGTRAVEAATGEGSDMQVLRGVSAVVLAAVVAATTTVTLASPASAEPPVAVDDNKTMYAGEGRAIDVLRNDSDPDGDELAICRVADVEGDDYAVFVEDNLLYVYTSGDRTENLVITYYACDFETLVPATLTISFKEIKPMKVVKLDRPGRLRVTNNNDRTVRFLYGSFDEDQPDGRTRVFAHDSVVIRVHRHKIDWVAFLGRGILVGIGHVRGIELPRDAGRVDLARLTMSRAEAKLWAAQR